MIEVRRVADNIYIEATATVFHEVSTSVLTCVHVSLFSCCLCGSDEDPESVIPREKLVALCKYEPVRLWMRSCDHVLYQALVEILIPDVLRPVPSQCHIFNCH